MASLCIDITRLWADILSSASIGVGRPGGLKRLALTEEDRAMRDHFVASCRQAGCTVRVDRFGNIFARRRGSDDALPAVLVGSHLDTQIVGGRYDGILGVLSGLEVIRTLNDHGVITKRAIEVVSWTNEEGVRFQPPMLGSGAFAGIHDESWVLAQTDDDGLAFGAELRRIGYEGSQRISPDEYDSYFELHIEQGPELEAAGLLVGIVEGGFTSFGAHLTIRGETAHAGPTPMPFRRNALVGASIIIDKLNRIGWQFAPHGRAAVCRMVLSPNKYGILPDLAEITIDVRHPEKHQAAAMYQQALDLLSIARQEANVEVEITKEWTFGDVEFDGSLMDLVQETADDLGVSNRKMLSAAGHDAYNMSCVMPSILIFTPCRNGVSHNEAEHIEPSYTEPGVNVLLHSVLRKANR